MIRTVRHPLRSGLEIPGAPRRRAKAARGLQTASKTKIGEEI